MKTDARVRYTKSVIRKEFLLLLKEKPIAKVSVKELCERAQINRATFYTHYQDTYELLAQIEEEMLTHLSELLVKTQTQDLTQVLTHVLENMRDYGELYSVVCSSHGDPAMLQKTAALCEAALASTAQQWGVLDENRIAMLQGFLASGTSGAFAGWMKNGMQLPPNEAAAFLVKLLSAAAHGAVERAL